MIEVMSHSPRLGEVGDVMVFRHSADGGAPTLIDKPYSSSATTTLSSKYANEMNECNQTPVCKGAVTKLYI